MRGWTEDTKEIVRIGRENGETYQDIASRIEARNRFQCKYMYTTLYLGKEAIRTNSKEGIQAIKEAHERVKRARPAFTKLKIVNGSREPLQEYRVPAEYAPRLDQLAEAVQHLTDAEARSEDTTEHLLRLFKLEEALLHHLPGTQFSSDM